MEKWIVHFNPKAKTPEESIVSINMMEDHVHYTIRGDSYAFMRGKTEADIRKDAIASVKSSGYPKSGHW
jgi:hypothetical protein